MRTALLAFVLTGSSLLAANAHAATATGNLNVSATVAGSCVVSAPGSLAFGAYDPVSANNTAPLSVPGTINVRCTRGTSTKIRLGEGLNKATGSSCTTPLRQMANGTTERMSYFLYSNSLYTTAWGCDTSNETTHVSTNSANAASLTVYGRVPGGQDVIPGTYTDTVQITLEF